MDLRPHGSVGHPATTCRSMASLVHSRASERRISRWPQGQFGPPEEPALHPEPLPPPAQPRMSRAGGAAAIACTVALFLLACAYSAFAGYAHSSNERYAFLAILGAVGSLLIAEMGVCIAAARNHRRMSARILLAAAVCSATLYAVLLFSA